VFGESASEKIEQGGKAERLLVILGIFLQLYLGNTLGVAGHTDDLDIGPESTNFGGEVRTADAGHEDVHEQDGNLALMELR